MKKLFVIVLLITPILAHAACPVYAPYRCTQGFNGKMICGCGV